MFIGFYNRSIILTFIGLFCTVFGICFALQGNYQVALIFLLLSGICDTFDGTIARLVVRTEEEKKYGVQLDSLVDVICFGVFPIIICMSLGYTSFFHVFVYCVFLFCGVTRLAYFNVDLERGKYFKGLPITTSSFILPIVLFFSIHEIFVMFSLLLMSFLFIFHIRIPKSDIRFKFLYLLLGIVIIGIIIFRHCWE